MPDYDYIRQKTEALIQKKKSPKGAAKDVKRTKIIEKRKELGLSQRDLATICETNADVICRIEKDASYDPKLSLAAKISVALGSTIETLF